MVLEEHIANFINELKSEGYVLTIFKDIGYERERNKTTHIPRVTNAYMEITGLTAKKRRERINIEFLTEEEARKSREIFRRLRVKPNTPENREKIMATYITSML